MLRSLSEFLVVTLFPSLLRISPTMERDTPNSSDLFSPSPLFLPVFHPSLCAMVEQVSIVYSEGVSSKVKLLDLDVYQFELLDNFLH